MASSNLLSVMKSSVITLILAPAFALKLSALERQRSQTREHTSQVSNDEIPTTSSSTRADHDSLLSFPGSNLKAQLLYQTNEIRAAHSLGSVSWDDDLSASVQKWANSCPGPVLGGPTTGLQNWANFKPCDKHCMGVAGAAWLWYNKGEKYWNYTNHNCSVESFYPCRVFKIMLNPGVHTVACGWSTCHNRSNVWCNYVGHDSNAVVPKRRENITKDALKDSLTNIEPHTEPTDPLMAASTTLPADINQTERSQPPRDEEPPHSSSKNHSDTSKSKGTVVLQFGWSDTDTSKIDSALENAGIVNFKRSDSSDKGLGIAVVTSEQAEAFKAYADDGEKVFANILKAIDGLSSTDDLRVSFAEDANHREIRFGGLDYGGIVTDDPSSVVSGTATGEQKGDDALWSTENGNSAEAKMWDGPGGRQYVTMDAEVED